MLYRDIECLILFGVDTTLFSIGRIQGIAANGIGFQAADSETAHTIQVHKEFSVSSLRQPCVELDSGCDALRDEDDLVPGLRICPPSPSWRLVEA
jgi:hypothetical protein